MGIAWGRVGSSAGLATLGSFGRCRSGCERAPDWVCAVWARAWFASAEPDPLMCALSACRRRGGCRGQGAPCRAQSRLNEALAPHGHPCWQRRQRRCCGGERDAPDHRGRDHEGPDQAEAHRRAGQARLARAAGQGRRALRPLRLPLLPGLRPWPIRAGNPLRGERTVAGLVLAGTFRPARMMKPFRAVRVSRDAAGTCDRARRHGPCAQGAGSRPAEGRQ